MEYVYYYDEYRDGWDDEAASTRIGQKALVIGRTHETGDKEAFSLDFSADAVAAGAAGNVDHSIRRFHGWRGTSYGVSKCAYGVHAVKSVEKQTYTDKHGFKRTQYRVEISRTDLAKGRP